MTHYYWIPFGPTKPCNPGNPGKPVGPKEIIVWLATQLILILIAA